MKIKFLIKEIEHQPIDIKFYHNFLLKRIKKVIDSLDSMKQEILEYIAGLGYDEESTTELLEFAEDEFSEPKKYIDRLLKRHEENGQTLKAAFDAKDSPYYQRKFLNYYKDFVGTAAEDSTYLSNYDFRLHFSNLEIYDKEREYFESMLSNINSEIHKLAPSLQKYYNKLKEMVKIWHSTAREYKPEHGPQEVLYHATLNASKLFEQGFQKEVPETMGIGGSQTFKQDIGKKAISFTSSLYVAKEIARCLKEVVYIAKGQLRFEHILNWAEKDGLKDIVYNGFKSVHGKSNNKILDTFNLYRIYLAHSNRYDPLFFDAYRTVEYAKTVNVSDVGVLQCRVDLTDDSKYEYYSLSMDEWRILPEAILEIERVIK